MLMCHSGQDVQTKFPISEQLFFLILYIPTSVYIFSLHFPRCWQGEFVKQSRASLVGEHFLYSHDPNVWFRDDNVRRNWILVTPRVNGAPSPSSVLERKLSTIYFSGQDVQAEFPFSSLLPFDGTLVLHRYLVGILSTLPDSLPGTIYFCRDRSLVKVVPCEGNNLFTLNSPFMPKHYYLYSPYCSLYIFFDTDKENLLDNQELLKLVITLFLLVMVTLDSGLLL